MVLFLAAVRATAARHCDQWSREREQTDEREEQQSDAKTHGTPPS